MTETMNDALIEAVKACGGSKAVGIALWPFKGVEQAQRQLLACLNPDRNEKLSPDEVLHILRLARERGCHVGMEYMATTLGYAPPVPVDPRDEMAELQRKFIEATENLQRMAADIQKRNARADLRSAA